MINLILSYISQGYKWNLSNLFFLGSIKLLRCKLFTPGLVGDDTLLNLFGGTAQA